MNADAEITGEPAQNIDNSAMRTRRLLVSRIGPYRNPLILRWSCPDPDVIQIPVRPVFHAFVQFGPDRAWVTVMTIRRDMCGG